MQQLNVTGGANGIGRGLVNGSRLKEGMKVVIADVSPMSLRRAGARKRVIG